MHLYRSWITLGLLAALAGSLAVRAAVVYKWTDADGVVHFSDQPVPGAEKIVTSSGSSRGVSLAVSGVPSTAAKPKRSGSLEFTQFAIVSPVKDETITGNQPVSVHLNISPALTATQSITWYLNGSPLSSQAPDATQFTLDDLTRGTYTVGATVTDQSSGESKSTESVTFYVVRTSVLSPQHK